MYQGCNRHHGRFTLVDLLDHFSTAAIQFITLYDNEDL